MFRVGILTISDAGWRGERQDSSGPAIAEILSGAGASVVQQTIVPDEREGIESTLVRWADDDEADVIITTGGTGLSPRDVTPEATMAVIDRVAPGFAEVIRQEGGKYTPMSMLGRGVAGVRGECLIINLPGSPQAVRQSLVPILPVLQHAVDTLKGRQGEHPAA